MNFLKSQKKTVGWLVLCSFIVFLSGCTAPLRGENAGVNKNHSVSSASGPGNDLAPGMVEKESQSSKTMGKKKFPWLLVIAGAVVIGVAAYFLFIYKPKYTLTVTVASGATGIPAAGSYVYKKGSAVAYDFTAQQFYKDLVVTLDGTAVAAAGTVTMDKDHTLAVSSQEGLHEDFTTSASLNWIRYHAANWLVVGGAFRCLAAQSDNNWEYILYNHAWSTANYTVTVRLQRSSNPGSMGIHLGTGTNMGAAYGYFFGTDSHSSYTIIRENGYGYAPYSLPSGSQTTIKGWTTSSAVNPVQQWNLYKIVKTGSSYSFYVNDTLLHSFSDATYDPRYLAIVLWPIPPWTQLDVDYAYVDVTSSPTSLPAAPASFSATPATYDIMRGDRWQ